MNRRIIERREVNEMNFNIDIKTKAKFNTGGSIADWLCKMIKNAERTDAILKDHKYTMEKGETLLLNVEGKDFNGVLKITA